MAKCPKCGKDWVCKNEDIDCEGQKGCSRCWCDDCKGYTPFLKRQHELDILEFNLKQEKYRLIDRSLTEDQVESTKWLIAYYQKAIDELKEKR